MRTDHRWAFFLPGASFLLSYLHSFSQYLLSNYSVPSPVPGAGDIQWRAFPHQLITHKDVLGRMWNEFIYDNVVILEKDSTVLLMSAYVLSVPREP